MGCEPHGVNTLRFFSHPSPSLRSGEGARSSQGFSWITFFLPPIPLTSLRGGRSLVSGGFDFDLIDFKLLLAITFNLILHLCILRGVFVSCFEHQNFVFVAISWRFCVHLSKIFYICLNQLKNALNHGRTKTRYAYIRRRRFLRFCNSGTSSNECRRFVCCFGYCSTHYRCSYAHRYV